MEKDNIVYVASLQSFNYKESGEVVEVHSSILGVYNTEESAWASVSEGMEAAKSADYEANPTCTNKFGMFRQVSITDADGRKWLYQWTVQPFTVL